MSSSTATIEAGDTGSRRHGLAAAVRESWMYVARLGPFELPAFVSPSGDERAMRADVGRRATSLDPEGD